MMIQMVPSSGKEGKNDLTATTTSAFCQQMIRNRTSGNSSDRFTSLSSTSSSSTAQFDSSSSSQVFSQKEDYQNASKYDEYLHPMPSQLHPIYRPIPILWKSFIYAFSFVISKFWALTKTAASTQGQIQSGKTLKQFLVVLTRALVIAVTTSTILQDIYLPPSRVSMSTLIQNQWLPSSLSRYEIISPLFTLHMDSNVSEGKSKETDTDMTLLQTIPPIGVHYLQYNNDGNEKDGNKKDEEQSNQTNDVIQPPKKHNFDAVYFNHGFGASSLSWLPAIPSLVQTLKGKVGIAHDAVGFGFTERPSSSSSSVEKSSRVENELAMYTSAGSAALGLSLLNRATSPTDNNNKDVDATPTKSSPSAVALLGHSRGSVATLRMALDLPSSTRKFIVLVSPFLMNESKSSSIASKTTTTSLFQSFDIPVKKKTAVTDAINAIKYVMFGIPVQYILRRLVGGKNFWRKGLQAAWGDPNKLTNNDVLRFQYPSIGKGWEKGILSYVKSVATMKSSYMPTYPGGEEQLLQDVLKLPNTYVAIVHGTKDRVVPSSYNEKYTAFYPNLRFVKMDGFGHDPFEEDVDMFVDVVKDLMKDAKFQ